MGMKNSAQSFQRLVSHVLKDIDGCFAYLDDLLIYSKNERDHLKILEQVFTRLKEAGLAISLDKCEFGKDTLQFLGYQVSKDGIAPVEKKITALRNYPIPVKQKQLLGFLGALNYYRASLPNLPPNEHHSKERTPAQILDPLYKLATCELPKKSKFEEIWENSKAVKEAFEDAKRLLEKAVTLNHPDPTAPLALTTDASKLALGATLDQWVDGCWRPLGMWSKTLKPAQQGYSTYRRELMGIQLAMRHFNDRFAGRPLIIFTDHLPLIGSMGSNSLQAHDPLAQNALNEIGQFTSDFRHKAGKDIPVADWLSRPEGRPITAEHDISSTTIAEESQPKYVPPEKTLAALEELAIQTLSPAAIAADQMTDEDVLAHKSGHVPKTVKCGTVRLGGVDLFCEISDPDNPRPLIPGKLRNVVLNLFHHGDHPGAKETKRRCTREYYWPKMKQNISDFVKTCHPCQQAKQSRSVDPGVGDFPVPDKRFSAIHLDIVGPLPESNGHKYLLTILDRCTRWTEAYPIRRDSAEEVARAFMQYVSRFGLPCSAVSDNGNAFISNLFQDILKSFGITVTFSPAYHAATNGAIERKHQDIKNALKAALVAMGNEHRDKWFDALPWVMLGQRVKFQPHLDASAAQLVMQMSPRIPGQLLGDPGPPLSNAQTRALLDQLYRFADRPAIQTSGRRIFKDISETEDATHVYIKVDKPESLCPKWEGPYAIISRPSRSTVEVKLGLFKNGEVRKSTYHWSSCKVANLRPGAAEASRPKLGRPPKKPPSDIFYPETDASVPDDASISTDAESSFSSEPVAPQQSLPVEFYAGNSNDVTTSRPHRSTRNPNPNYKT